MPSTCTHAARCDPQAESAAQQPIYLKQAFSWLSGVAQILVVSVFHSQSRVYGLDGEYKQEISAPIAD